MKNIGYLLALHTVEGLGSIRLKKLMDYFKDPKVAWESSKDEWIKAGIPPAVVSLLQDKKKTLEPYEYYQKIKEKEIKVCTFFDDDYPENLKNIFDPPLIIYYKGNLMPSDVKSIGIVGTRKVTGYGKLVTEKFASELSNLGVTINSGLARGVDTLSHLAALHNNGRTIAVLGGGLNKIYPPENIGLAERIVNEDRGAVISEFPPDYPHLAGNFPARNRIISGLSLGVLITEAAIDSGSLITARFAIDQGREVFAVPGPITSLLSQGPAQLIQQGAKLVTTISDITDELGLPQQVNSSKLNTLQDLDKNEKDILELLENETKHVDELSRELKISIPEISGYLIKMEIMGVVKNLGGGTYCVS